MPVSFAQYAKASSEYDKQKSSDTQEDTELLQAVRDGKIEIVEFLIDKHHANKDVRDKDEFSLLMIAAEQGNIKMVACLIDKGADLKYYIHYAGLQAEVSLLAQNCGLNALMCASRKGHADIAELLLKQGADVELKTWDGKTALNLAEEYVTMQAKNAKEKHNNVDTRIISVLMEAEMKAHQERRASLMKRLEVLTPLKRALTLDDSARPVSVLNAYNMPNVSNSAVVISGKEKALTQKIVMEMAPSHDSSLSLGR